MLSIMKYTSNGKFKYKGKHFGHSLETWVKLGHEYNIKKNGWRSYPLKPGAFGYDCIAISFARVFEVVEKDKNVIDNKYAISDIIHKGWAENYVYWRDSKPWNDSDFFFSPSKSLGDERRNLLAETKYKKLPQEEQAKDDILARFLIKAIKQYYKENKDSDDNDD